VNVSKPGIKFVRVQGIKSGLFWKRVDGYYYIQFIIEQIKNICILVQLITALVQENIIRLATATLT